MILNDREITRLAEAGIIAPFAEGVARPGVISYGAIGVVYLRGKWGSDE